VTPSDRPARSRRGRPKPDPARRAAFDLLRAVDERGSYANLALPEILRQAGLTGRDAAFATELGYGTLRGHGTYDAVIAACIDRPLDEVDAAVLDVARLGAHQLLAMRVPTHAAVAATVELGRAVLGDGRAKFVNAVLRRVSETELEAWLERVAPAYDVDPVGHLAVRYSHPRWIVSALCDALGGSLEETAELLAADNTPAEVSLVARPGRATVAELLDAGAREGRWSPYAATWPGGDPAALPAVRERRAGVQDEGSQLAALALAAAPVEGRDEVWLDLCAGPGGKAALLGGVGAGRGARLLAVELAPHRARSVARAVGSDTEVVVGDGLVPAWRAGAFDRVLVDAPCTGLGALRRRPESRWRRQPTDVGTLVDLQRNLLGSALDATRAGGVVAYVTCSPHLAETRVVVLDLLRKRSDVEQLDARPFFPGVPDLGDGPHVQLWPHRHGTDAMFTALLRRT
jgi:16S rRNA (cytosine967-C5)-methyltransferase